MDEFKVGDVVMLKGYERPKMVIEHISQKTDGKVASCKWFFDVDKIYKDDFLLQILKKV